MAETGIAIKSEPLDEDVEFQTQPADNLQVKQEYEFEDFTTEDPLLNTDILDAVKTETRDAPAAGRDKISPSCTKDFSVFNEIELDIVMKPEPVSGASITLTDQVDEQLTNNLSNNNSVAKQDVANNTKKDFNEVFLDFQKDSIKNKKQPSKRKTVATKSPEIVEGIIDKLNLDPAVQEQQYCGKKPCDPQCESEAAEKPPNCPTTSSNLSEEDSVSKKNYKCTSCNYTSSRKSVLHKHSKNHKKKVVHKCNKCEYCSTDRRLYQQHLTTHAKPFKCTKCKYRASRQLYLDVHLKTHVNSAFKCYQCEYTATHRSTVTRHFNAVHLNV